MIGCPVLPFSWNLLADLGNIWCFQFMQNAILTGTIVAFISGVTGYFIVLRRSAFTAHAFSEIGFAGAAGAILVGLPPLGGLLLGSITAGIVIAALGRRVTYRDTQIGIVLAFSLGLGLLFIKLYSAFAEAAISILFGQILGISPAQVTYTLIAGVGVIAAMGIIYRPLLFASLDEGVAEAKGLPMFAIGAAFLLIVAVAVSFAIQVTGVLLIFSLTVTPAATAQYLSKHPARVILLSVIISLAATWVGLFVGFYTPYPVSFFVTTIVFVFYVLVRGLRHKIGIPT